VYFPTPGTAAFRLISFTVIGCKEAFIAAPLPKGCQSQRGDYEPPSILDAGFANHCVRVILYTGVRTLVRTENLLMTGPLNPE
jgi:hypothetical protein